jgi:uncharacterized damage-inducible protein DinB
MNTALVQLVAHMEWADTLVVDSLERAHGAAPEAEKAYAHLVAAEHHWLSRIHQRDPRLSIQPVISLAEARALATENAVDFRTLLAMPDVSRPVRYRTLAGREFVTPLDEIVTHVCLHGAYHRGQVSTLLRQAGAEPVATDFIAFVRLTP